MPLTFELANTLPVTFILSYPPVSNVQILYKLHTLPVNNVLCQEADEWHLPIKFSLEDCGMLWVDKRDGGSVLHHLYILQTKYSCQPRYINIHSLFRHFDFYVW